jgi:phosphoserine phosphatase
VFDYKKKRVNFKKSIQKKNNIMKQFRVMKVVDLWSTNRLRRKVERLLNQLANEGYEVVSVSFGFNIWFAPKAYITVKK